MSWSADSQAVAQNAMMHPWDRVSYLFPPTPLLLRVLQKFREELISGVIVLPMWPSALWWPLLQEMLIQPIHHLPFYREALVPVHQELQLPYLEPLVAAHIKSPVCP